MFIRKKENKSGSVSIQIIDKISGKYKVVKTIGSSQTEGELASLLHQAKKEWNRIQLQTSLFISDEDAILESFLNILSNSNVRVINPELIFGKIYDSIGFNKIEEKLFRHLVI